MATRSSTGARKAKSRSASSTPAKKTTSGKKSATKKASAKKSTAKPTPAKKSTAKPTAAKKSASGKKAAAKAVTGTGGDVSKPKARKKSGGKAPDEPRIPLHSSTELTADDLEFIEALNGYKRDHGRLFPKQSEILHVLRFLGYRKSDGS